MVLSTLPPPPHPEPDVLHANEILVKGYHAASSILGLAQPNLHQVQYYRERVWLELVPLLDAIFESASDPATRSWCCTVTTAVADLFNQLTEHEASAKKRFTIPDVPPNGHDRY